MYSVHLNVKNIAIDDLAHNNNKNKWKNRLHTLVWLLRVSSIACCCSFIFFSNIHKIYLIKIQWIESELLYLSAFYLIKKMRAELKITFFQILETKIRRTKINGSFWLPIKIPSINNNVTHSTVAYNNKDSPLSNENEQKNEYENTKVRIVRILSRIPI